MSTLPKISDIKKEEDAYGLMIKNLITLITAGLWWDKPYWDLWIYKVSATYPKGKWTDTHSNLVKTEGKASKTPEFKEDDTEKKVDKIQIQLDREVVANLNSDNEKVKAGESLSKKLNEALFKMAKLFYLFFREDWSTGWTERKSDQGSDTSQSTISLSVNKLAATQMFMTKEKVGNLTYHVLNFVRIYQGRYYKCAVYFQGEGFTTQIRSHYIWYKDKAWNQGGYYQANGAYGSSRNHIGGNEEKVKKQGYEWTEIDSQISKMWDNFETQPWYTWRWLHILSTAIQTQEARDSFNKTSYYTIGQKRNSISRRDSTKKEFYKRIHPFAEIFYDVDQDWGLINSINWSWFLKN